ncbi:MAG TPA: hypothetical protein VJJ23_02155 [Candidatus Nanoarchaeia archaeon]|nr:hypothetical protein [Candidatus Nanoarchaeia archaeon]
MNKKGEGSDIEEQGAWIWSIIELAIVAFALFGIVNRAMNGDVYDNDFLSKDLGLMIDVAQSSPGELNVDYAFNKERMINVDEKRSIIVKSGEKFDRIGIYYFSYNQDFAILNNEIRADKININLKNKEVKIS